MKFETEKEFRRS